MTTSKVFIQVRDGANKEIRSTNGLVSPVKIKQFLLGSSIPILPMKKTTGKS